METKRGRRSFIEQAHKVSLYYSKTDYDKLRKIAADYGISISSIIRHLISEYIRNPFDISKKK